MASILNKDNVRSKLIRISAHDRRLTNPGDTNSQFKISVPSHAEHFRSVVGIQTIAAAMPNVFYNVPFYDAANSTLYSLVATGPAVNASISRGQYTVEEVMLWAEGELTTQLGEAVVLSLSANDTKVSITFTAATPTFTVDEGSILHLLGFSGNEVYNGFVLTADYMPILNGPSMVYIHCPELTAGVSDFDRQGDIHNLLKISLDQPFTFICHYRTEDAQSAIIEYPSPRYISTFSFTLRDVRGKILDIQNHDWTLELKLFYIL